MIKIELNLYPEKIYNYQQNNNILYTEEDIEELHQLAINNNLNINTILQNKTTQTYYKIIGYVNNPQFIYTTNNEASFIRCQYTTINGKLGHIVNFSYTISELLNDFLIMEKKD